ncbi:MAG: BrnA antitoxin family protein [Chloroflexota bacterium]|nr:BrnA antitoxin family protein [Chloroflexota bacterium]
MENEENIVSYTMDELQAMNARGEGKTNWDRPRTMTDEELEATIDWEEEGEWDLDSARPDIPGPHQRLTMLIDDDIIAWFRTEVEGTGLGFKTRMNDALREYMETRQERLEPVEAGADRRAG